MGTDLCVLVLQVHGFPSLLLDLMCCQHCVMKYTETPSSKGKESLRVTSLAKVSKSAHSHQREVAKNPTDVVKTFILMRDKCCLCCQWKMQFASKTSKELVNQRYKKKTDEMNN